MKKLIKAALFCAAAAGFIPYDLRKTEEGEVQSRSLFLEIRKKEQSNGETQVQVSFPMVERVESFGKKLAQQLKDSCTAQEAPEAAEDACQEEAAECACDAECAAQAGDADAACACAEEAQACAEEASACPCGQQPEEPQPTEA
ncbi:MAG: hypothetical protein Q4D08_06910 [Clostridia bacterium]|nr:hypothetical protein [Clostridia bacterium]